MATSRDRRVALGYNPKSGLRTRSSCTSSWPAQSQGHGDVFLKASDSIHRADSRPTGSKAQLKVKLIVLEATGGIERDVVATGIDAAVLAHYDEAGNAAVLACLLQEGRQVPIEHAMQHRRCS